MEPHDAKRAASDQRHAATREGTSSESRIVPEDIKACVWMDAGLLTWWLCDRELQCAGCPLDAALRHTSPERVESRSRQPLERTPSPGSAPEATPTDPHAWMVLVERAMPPLDARALYAPSHVWVRDDDDDTVRLGLDAFASWVVGRLRCVVLLPAGMRINRGEPCGWLDQPGGTLTVTSPVSGDIVECNTSLIARGACTLDDPFGVDWLLRIRPWRLRTETRSLMAASQFEAVVDEHALAWRRLLRRAVRAGTERAGPTLADGGRAIAGLDELLGARRHHRIAAGYLRTSH